MVYLYSLDKKNCRHSFINQTLMCNVNEVYKNLGKYSPQQNADEKFGILGGNPVKSNTCTLYGLQKVFTLYLTSSVWSKTFFSLAGP